MRAESVPEPTLRRLPSYYHYLVRLREKGQVMISAAQIGEDLVKCAIQGNDAGGRMGHADGLAPIIGNAHIRPAPGCGQQEGQQGEVPEKLAVRR